MTQRSNHDEAPRAERLDAGLWVGLALGFPLMAYGAWQLVRQTSLDRAVSIGVWVGGGAVLHDALLAPLLAGVVWLIGRVVPSAYRNSVRTGVLGTALIIALAGPALAGYGNRTDNPSIHPLDYDTAVLTAVGALWAAVLAHMLWRRRSVTRRERLM